MTYKHVDLVELSEVNALLSNGDYSIVESSGCQTMFVAGRAEDDYGELLFSAARWWLKHNTSTNLVIPGHDGSYRNEERVATGYPGFKNWKAEILRICASPEWSHKNVSPNHILPCVVRKGHEKITHTREETDGFVLRAMGLGWKSAFVMANFHQLPRLMGCLLKSLDELGYSLKAQPIAPHCDWRFPVYGSLGQKQFPRWQHVKEEIDRMEKYIANGWMVPLATLRDYLLNLPV